MLRRTRDVDAAVSLAGDGDGREAVRSLRPRACSSAAVAGTLFLRKFRRRHGLVQRVGPLLRLLGGRPWRSHAASQSHVEGVSARHPGTHAANGPFGSALGKSDSCSMCFNPSFQATPRCGDPSAHCRRPWRRPWRTNEKITQHSRVSVAHSVNQTRAHSKVF